jgi:repressor of nif and glnA expression
MDIRESRIRTAILKVLNDIEGSAGAARVRQKLLAVGIGVKPRTVRYHLLQLDRAGLTQLTSRRRGRKLTDSGRREAAHANVLEKVGFVAAKVDSLGYRMTFSARNTEGTIIANIALIGEHLLGRALSEMRPIFAAGLGMGTRLAVANASEHLGGHVVPHGQVALGTVCSVTVNGMMMHESIPVISRFGGLLEMRDRKPIRFVELMEYRGTTIDPLEVFIQAGMTSVRECARTGTGLIGASFREIPAVAAADVLRVQQQMEEHQLSGILAVGNPGQPLLDIPVAEGRAGMVVVGGLNPVAAIHEAGTVVSIRSLVGLEDLSRFRNISEF